jgi:hypothetical protein
MYYYCCCCVVACCLLLVACCLLLATCLCCFVANSNINFDYGTLPLPGISLSPPFRVLLCALPGSYFKNPLREQERTKMEESKSKSQSVACPFESTETTIKHHHARESSHAACDKLIQQTGKKGNDDKSSRCV